MTKELDEYYSNYFELFRTKGWTQLVQEFKTNVDLVNSVETTKDSNDLYFRKGQLSVLATILNLEEYINQGHKDASENV